MVVFRVSGENRSRPRTVGLPTTIAESEYFGMIQQRKKILAFILLLVDLVLTAGSFFLAYFVRSLIALDGFTVMPIGIYIWLLWLMLPIWAILLPAFGVYSSRFLSPKNQFVQLSKAVGFAWVVTAAGMFFVGYEATSRLIAVFTLVINYAALVSYRMVLFAVRNRSQTWIRHVAVIGDQESAEELVATIEAHREWGLRPIGVFPEAEAREVLERGGIDEVIFVVDRQRFDSCEELFLMCEELGVTARVVLDLFPHTISRMELHELEGFPLLTFSPTPSDEVVLFIRRILDIVLSGVLLVAATPIMAVAGIAIKLTSRGPILFTQERCGLHGRRFEMYKFRSMVDDAEQRRYELEALNEMDGPVFKSSRDPRVTPVGKFLRRFSIDELPQLYNVLKGDMSLVGPRPPLPQEVQRYKRWQRRRLSMKPGITCLWQISGRNQVGFEEWMKLDLTYIDNWSLLLDLKILIKTVPAVLMGKGAR